MGMSAGGHGEKAVPYINVTPLIDVLPVVVVEILDLFILNLNLATHFIKQLLDGELLASDFAHSRFSLATILEVFLIFLFGHSILLLLLGDRRGNLLFAGDQLLFFGSLVENFLLDQIVKNLHPGGS